MAPKGNQFWKLRSTHGREKLFATPELLWEAASEYFNWIDSHPWYKVEGIKSGDSAGKLMKIPTVRPYTLRAFLLYIHASENYWSEFKKANHIDFLGVIDEIENAMYSQKFEGAAVGAFNSNIISRDLGLKENIDATTNGRDIVQKNLVFVDANKLTDDQINKIMGGQDNAGEQGSH